MILRSLIFVPSNSKRFIEKAKALNADIICFDLEDSVPFNEKTTARQAIVDVLAKKAEYRSNIYIRINSLESGLAFSDLKSIIQEGVDGIVVPKVNDKEEVNQIEHLTSSLEKERGIEKDSIKLMPSIESAKGVVNAHSIAKSVERINALVFGVFDFLYDMHLDYVEDDEVGYQYARAKIPVDARAAGVAALDGIWQKVHDIEGLRNDASIARRLGYSGKTIIHPSHIDPVHKIFMPSKNEIEWAKKVLQALREPMEMGDGKGAIKLEGKMIDAAHYKQAKAILNTIDELE
ncbi:MAG TPA: CoA ester lyase [Nitrososphaeraceae archaeon]|jgi:citrate lyase subunit beta / citryl-CoA lyase|nr:CoA ester lyase [Nitrososphaeraceae archaeon]